jgi:hypothetical protein
MKYIRQRKNGNYQVRVYDKGNKFSFTSPDLDSVVKARNEHLGYDPDEECLATVGSNILIIDIETTPILAWVWRTWKENIYPDQIEVDWSILCYAYKWLGDKTVKFYRYDQPTELEAVVHIWSLFEDADIIVTHNGDRFDIKKINTKFLQYSFPKPSPYKSVDTLKILKKKFSLTSNRQGYVSTFLGYQDKIEHEGIKLWLRCMDGDEEAWKLMKSYNIRDVEQLEHNYLKLRAWDNHPAIYDDGCNLCGNNELELVKPYKTMISTFETYRCTECGNLMRERKAIKRNTLVNVN